MEVSSAVSAAYAVAIVSIVSCEESIMLNRSLRIAILVAMLSIAPLAAHHSHGNYDLTKWTTMEGKVTEVHLLVPHSWIYLEVKDAKGGEPTVWALEATGPGGLERVGIKKQ